MKIARVQAFPIRMPRDLRAATGTAGSPSLLGTAAGAYRWSTTVAALYSEYFETTLVKVTLDNGLHGWGEAQAPLAPRVSAVIVQDLLAAVVEGAEFDGNRAPIEYLWSRMYQAMRVRGQTGGFMLDAISGIDIALWDLAGRIHGVPVSHLISERARRTVPAYLSGVSGGSAVERTAYAAGFEGFDTFKVFFDSADDNLVELLDCMRERLAPARIAVDALWRLSLPASEALLQRLETFNLHWLEAPFQPDEFDAHRAIAHRFPLAIGESYRTCAELRPFLDAGIARYIQPDLGRSGITETLRIAGAGPEIVPHVSIACGPQIAAAIHAAAAIDNCPICEYNPAVFEQSNRFLVDPLEMEGAAYRVPQTPGLGVDIREAAIEPWVLTLPAR